MLEAPPPVAPPRVANLLVVLLRSYLNLGVDQVTVYNQKWKIPADSRLYLSIAFLMSRAYAGGTTYADSADRSQLVETTTLNVMEAYTVNIMSRSQEAFNRRHEVTMAFGSTAAEQMAEANDLKLARLPIGFTDISRQEGTSMLGRYACTVNVLSAQKQSRVVESYVTFPTPTLLINP